MTQKNATRVSYDKTYSGVLGTPQRPGASLTPEAEARLLDIDLKTEYGIDPGAPDSDRKLAFALARAHVKGFQQRPGRGRPPSPPEKTDEELLAEIPCLTQIIEQGRIDRARESAPARAQALKAWVKQECERSNLTRHGAKATALRTFLRGNAGLCGCPPEDTDAFINARLKRMERIVTRE